MWLAMVETAASVSRSPHTSAASCAVGTTRFGDTRNRRSRSRLRFPRRLTGPSAPSTSSGPRTLKFTATRVSPDYGPRRVSYRRQPAEKLPGCQAIHRIARFRLAAEFHGPDHDRPHPFGAVARAGGDWQGFGIDRASIGGARPLPSRAWRRDRNRSRERPGGPTEACRARTAVHGGTSSSRRRAPFERRGRSEDVPGGRIVQGARRGPARRPVDLRPPPVRDRWGPTGTPRPPPSRSVDTVHLIIRLLSYGSFAHTMDDDILELASEGHLLAKEPDDCIDHRPALR